MLSLPHLLLVLLIVVLIFGAGRIPRVMGDIGKGVRSLREGLKGDDAAKIEDKNKDQDKPNT